MKTNLGKIYVPLSFSMLIVVPFDNVQITSILSEKLLGITFGSELNFNISGKFVK